jgi:hypothetical protein
MADLIARHIAESDDGEAFEVLEYQHYTERRMLSGKQMSVPTVREYVLSDGRDVNWIDSETFKIVETDQIIRKVG